jgi:hypothetical protein
MHRWCPARSVRNFRTRQYVAHRRQGQCRASAQAALAPFAWLLCHRDRPVSQGTVQSHASARRKRRARHCGWAPPTQSCREGRRLARAVMLSSIVLLAVGWFQRSMGRSQTARSTAHRRSRRDSPATAAQHASHSVGRSRGDAGSRANPPAHNARSPMSCHVPIDPSLCQGAGSRGREGALGRPVAVATARA